MKYVNGIQHIPLAAYFIGDKYKSTTTFCKYNAKVDQYSQVRPHISTSLTTAQPRKQVWLFLLLVYLFLTSYR